MKEAIGSTWILGIVLTFIALFSGYLAFSVNYSKAFRVKDGIVDIIEKHNGPTKQAIKDINDLMTTINYNSTGTCSTFFDNKNLSYIGVKKNIATKGNQIGPGNSFNYCLQEVENVSTIRDGQLASSYFKVYVFFSISLPFLGGGGMFHISGETSNLYIPDTECMGGCTA